jgi:hypothetical protein
LLCKIYLLPLSHMLVNLLFIAVLHYLNLCSFILCTNQKYMSRNLELLQMIFACDRHIFRM